MSLYADPFSEEENPLCKQGREEHKHWCDGCASVWKHEDPCDYETHRGVLSDWPCPMCFGGA